MDNNSVTAAKILDGNITNSKYAEGSITSSKLAVNFLDKKTGCYLSN